MSRPFERAYLRVPVTVAAGAARWRGRTREVSARGCLALVEPPYPAGPCRVELDLPGGALCAGAGVRFTLPGVGVGLEFVGLPAADRRRLEELLDAAAATFGAGGLVGRYLAGSAPAARTPPERSLTPVVLQEISQHLLQPVGPGGAAYRILFTRPGSSPPELSDLADRVPGFSRAVAGRVELVAAQDVWLKLHAGSQPKPFRVVRLRGGGFAAAVVTEVPGALPRVDLLHLGVHERIAVAHRGQSLYPHFTAAELDELLGCADGPPGYSPWQAYDGARGAELTERMRRDRAAEVRRYGERVVTIHPALKLRLRFPGGSQAEGVAFHDGRRPCLLEVGAGGALRVLALEPGWSFCVTSP